MRRLTLILEAIVLMSGASRADNSSENSAPQLPVGQVFKQFEFPAYENGKLKYTLFATEAKGITLNRAATTDLVIKVYDADGKTVTTTITSPIADLLVAEQRMRTKNTVQIDRSDMTATSQTCDFDVKNKKFVMRSNVKVVLKHFDLSQGPNGSAPATAKATSTSTPAPVPAPMPASTPAPVRDDSSMLTSPGTYSDTNSAPLPPPSTDTK